ncbi:VWA domain-containing protein [Gryllotalpicola protaetiae]|uniref:VWA domain-containing protein n=1 Tax=Gryllotalpicola protaetiae TaxID=2419771 RepID=A0A387BLC9_9MICO|nr:VWA domain-containing protein [Gryllotalpicola protaetiae]AYG04683.1 VWA domain-containing protein [Gryllotalpicola protaetiae]
MTLDAAPLLVLGAVVVAALIVVAIVFDQRRSAALARLGANRAGSGRARRIGICLTIAGVGVLAFGAAGPAASVPVPRASGTVMIAMDVSQSMSATDVKPSRIVAAEKAAKKFIDAQPSSVDIGVVAFEEGALVTTKPNADHSQALNAIERLKVSGGTSLAAAITGSLAAITGKTVTIGQDGQLPDLGYWGSATIVIFSDGQDTGNPDAVTAAELLAQQSSVHVDTVGVGTTAGTTVTVDGYRLHTALDEDTLKGISQITSGAYHPATDAAQLGSVAKSIDLRLTLQNKAYPLAGGLIGLALALLLAGAVLTVAGTGRVV